MPDSTTRSLVLPVTNNAATVLQDTEAYQQLFDLAAEASAAKGIRQGLDDLGSGRIRPARAVFDELRAKHGLPR